MKSVKVAPFRIGRHEFYRAARTMAKSIDKEKILIDIIGQRNHSKTLFSKQFVLIVLIFLVISATESDLFIDVKTSIASIKITKLYAVVFLALSCGFSIIQFINYMTINEYHRLYSARILGFDNANVRSASYDGSNVWSYPFNTLFRFLKSTTTHKIWTWIALVIMMLPIFVMYYIIYNFEAIYIYNYVIGPNYVPYGRSLCFIAALFLIFPLLVLAFTFIPIKFDKNFAFIRWIFLLRLYKKTMSAAHDGSHWGIRPKQPGDLGSTLDN